MLDHGQLGPTPSSMTNRPAESVSDTPPSDSTSQQRASANGPSLRLSGAAVPSHPPPSSSPSDLAAQLHSHSNLSMLRASGSLVSHVQGIIQRTGPPILTNPKCSGYFVEPVCGSPLSSQCSLQVFYKLDVVDGIVPCRRTIRWEDCMS